MFAQLLIHPTTRQALEAHAKQPPHALLFIGPDGVGKLTLATIWARAVAGSAPQVISPDERGTITIEMIRELYRAARSKRERQQVIIVDHADHMSLEAENAFLKLLEEPRPGVTFILTTPNSESLLPTIQSRVQRLTVQPLPTDELQKFALSHAAKPNSIELQQLLFIAKGRPATLVSLLESTETLSKERQYMSQAKELLVAEPYQRFLFANKFSNDRQACNTILEAMLRMVSLQLVRSDKLQETKRWITLADALENTLLQLSRNGNVKAQLLKLFTSY